MFDVPISTYAEAIDMDFSTIDEDTVPVDRRGYSPRVAAELGESYLQNRYVVVDTDQHREELRTADGYSFDDELVEDIFDSNDVLDAMLDDRPLQLDLSIDFEDDAFQINAIMDDDGIQDAVEDATALKREMNELDADQLRDAETLAEHHAEAAELRSRLGDIRREFDVALGSVTRSEFSFDFEEAKGYTIYSDTPICVLFEGDEVPWDTGKYHATEERTEELDAVLESLYGGDKLDVREDAVMARMKELAETRLQELGYDHERDTVGFYRTLKENTEEMPTKWHVLQDLMQDDDISQLLAYQARDETEEDMFQYLEPGSTKAELVLSRIADFAEDKKQEVTILEFVDEDGGDGTSSYQLNINVYMDDEIKRQLQHTISDYLQQGTSNQTDFNDTYSKLEQELLDDKDGYGDGLKQELLDDDDSYMSSLYRED